jgi:hypothetical protein
MRRALDELAEALSAAQGGDCWTSGPRRIAASVELRQQFGLPITPSRWSALQRALACPLPPLERRRDGLWSFPRGWRTVWDLAAFLAGQCPDWQAPHGRALADWQEAQVFVAVRVCLIEALNVSADEVVRTARLMADLGAE